MSGFEVRLKRLERLRAAYTHVLSETPEEDAWKKIEAWATSKGLLEKDTIRIFGRNTYPTSKSEPHGYEYYVTVGPNIEPEGDIEIQEISEGLYAVLRFTGLNNMRDAWTYLWRWITESDYEHIGWHKGDYGWVNGFEEHINWSSRKPQSEWIFDLWIQLKE